MRIMHVLCNRMNGRIYAARALLSQSSIARRTSKLEVNPPEGESGKEMCNISSQPGVPILRDPKRLFHDI